MTKSVPVFFSLFSVVLSFLHAAIAFGDDVAFETRSITLYDVGVMQVKKQATVNNIEQVELSVPSAHLDDVLNSLLITTIDSVQITGIDYPMVKNIAQAVAAGSVGQSLTDRDGDPALPIRFSDTVKLYVGVKVRLLLNNNKRSYLEGTVMGVVDDDAVTMVPIEVTRSDHSVQVGDVAEKALCAVLLTSKGSLLKVPLIEIQGVELLSNGEVTALNDLARELGKSNGFEEKVVVLRMEKGARGKVTAEYVQQAPRWRMWYRLVKKGANLFLEGWAQVHNDTTEDWQRVAMTLISGNPDSYLVSVASPRYGERESIELQNAGAMMPQLGAQTPDRLLYDYHSGLGYMSGTGFGGGSGSAAGRATIGRSRRGVAVADDLSSTLLSVGDSAVKEMATAAVDAEISTYRVLQPVSIQQGSSAMVPVLNRKIDGQFFSRIDPRVKKVSACVRLENQTGVVLQSGLVSIFAEGRFRGQSELSRTEPNNATILCYGEDEDVTFDSSQKMVKSVARRLEWKNGTLFAHSLRELEHTYALNNKSGQQRTLGVIVRHVKNGRLVSNRPFVKVTEGGRNKVRLSFVDVAARAKKNVTLVTEEAIQVETAQDLDQLKALSKEATIPERERTVVKAVIAAKEKMAKIKMRFAENKKKKERLEKSIKNDRTNMASLPKMWGRARVAKKILAAIFDKTDEVASIEQQIDLLGQSLKQLENEPDRLLSQLRR